MSTELDDAVERVLGRYILDTLDRIDARNEICALIAAAGLDVYTQVPEPADMRVLPAVPSVDLGLLEPGTVIHLPDSGTVTWSE